MKSATKFATIDAPSIKLDNPSLIIFTQKMRVLHFLHDKAIGRTTLRPGRLTSTRDATCFAKSKRKVGTTEGRDCSLSLSLQLIFIPLPCCRRGLMWGDSSFYLATSCPSFCPRVHNRMCCSPRKCTECPIIFSFSRSRAMHDAEEAVMKGFLSGAMIILEDEFVQASFRDPFERVLESICRQLKTCLSFVCFNLQKYGSGRAQLGLDGIAPESISDRKEEDARPALKEYLEFGKAIGEDIEDVQRQLKINGTSVLMDNESRQFLEAWQAEEMAAYEMFEYMLQDPSQVGSGDEHPVGSLSSGSKSVLMRNKNRVQHGLGRLGTIRRKKSSLTSRKKLSATDSKLIRNKARYNDVTSFSGSTDAPEFELIASSPESDTDQTPTLNDPPKRSYASVMEVSSNRFNV